MRHDGHRRRHVRLSEMETTVTECFDTEVQATNGRLKIDGGQIVEVRMVLISGIV